MSPVDDFLSGLDEDSRASFQHIRALVTEVVPDAQEGTSYGMAALRLRGKPLIGFGAAKHHLSLYPFSTGAVDAVRKRLGGFDVSKGTVRFTAATPLPDEVVSDLVRYRAAEILGPRR